MTVKPLAHQSVVFCPRDDAEMKPEIGFEIRRGECTASWIYWRCTLNSDHLSCAVPDPSDTRL